MIGMAPWRGVWRGTNPIKAGQYRQDSKRSTRPQSVKSGLTRFGGVPKTERKPDHSHRGAKQAFDRSKNSVRVVVFS